MRAIVENYRAIQQAEIPLDRLTLIAGPNEAGKSSIAQAVAAALTGRAVLVPETLKKDAVALVRDGAPSGNVTVSGDDGSVSITWPSCDVGTRSTPPSISPAAAGLLSIVTMPDAERSATLIAALKAEPNKAALHARLERSQLGAMTEKIWPIIEAAGWDGAEKEVKIRTTSLKGEWEAITGERWGEKKASGWTPQGWNRLANKSLDELATMVDQSRADLERAVATAAVACADRAGLEALAATVASLERQEAAALKERHRLNDEHSKMLLVDHPVPSDPLPCPHCGAFTVFRGGALVDAGEITPALVTAARQKAEAHRQATADAKIAFQTAYDRHGTLKRKLVEARQAATKLASLPASGGAAGDVETARAACQEAETAYRLAGIRDRAEKTQHRIGRHLLLADILSPTGLRKEALTAALGELNRDLAALSDMAGWPRVSVNDQSLAVFYGTRRYHLVSAAAQYRVRATLQLALARAARDRLVILDGADILDGRGRLGLLKMLRDAGMPALVTMTYTAAKDVPDLGAKGLGVTMWLADGRATRVGAPVVERMAA